MVGIAVSISLGVTIFSSFQSGATILELALLMLSELFIVLFSIATFSIYLAKMAAKQSENFGLRKSLGTSSWNLFLETSVQTTLLVLLSILFSVGLIDVSMLIAGLNFEVVLQSIGVLHYGALLLAVFILSEGMLFIIQGVALAPNARSEFDATTIYEKHWFLRLAKALCKLSMFFGLLAIVSFVFLYLSKDLPSSAPLLEVVFYSLLFTWWFVNRRENSES